MEHTHDHRHPHTQEAVQTAQMPTGEKTQETRALLTYMIRHNEHHAEELAELMDSLPREARKKMSVAIGSFEAANVELQAVLDCLP